MPSGVVRADTSEPKGRCWLNMALGGIKFKALVDSGAENTIMGSLGLQLARACGRNLRPCKGSASLSRMFETRCSGYVSLPFELGGETRDVDVAILPDFVDQCYLGIDFLRTFHTSFEAYPSQLRAGDMYYDLEVAAFSVSEEEKSQPSGLAEVTSSMREQVAQLVERLIGTKQSLGCTTWVEHDINVTTTRPIKQRYYPVSETIQQVMHAEVEEMLHNGVIEPSDSGWSSPVTMQRKSNGKYRFCIDYRKVNAVTVPDAYPLPFMDTILRKLRKAKFISTLDLSSAYHQIPLSERSKKISAFTVPGKGLFQFRRLPYGLSNAPATFQRLMDRIIGPELEPYAYAYLDDIIIVTETFEEHLKWLEYVLQRINEAGLTINREKSKFCRDEVCYLGILVGRQGLRPDPKKTEPITAYPAPSNLKQLRRFLGMASWYRKFLKDYAAAIEPMNRLLRKGQKYSWGEEQEQSFLKVKNMLATAPVLERPQLNQPFTVQTDASDSGIGAVLTQVVDGKERVLEYASRTLIPAERNYSVTERECLAVIWAIQKFRPYIEGSHFTVITDHSSLRWLCNLKNPTGRLSRWALDLQGYDFDIQHRKGALNHVPDALSRMYEEEKINVSAASVEPETGDDWYDHWFDKVSKSPTDFPRWKIIANKLYVYRPDPVVEDTLGDTEAWKLVLPKALRKEVLYECHDEAASGHLGREKTFARVAKYYYWPKYYQETATYVRQCLVCQQIKTEQKLPTGLMGTRTISRPWEVVAADVMGPFVRSAHGHEYVLIFEDLFTRWVECVPLRKANARSILEAFKERVIWRFGVPEVFLTDNGTEFKNKTVEEYLKTKNIYHSFTPAYHPQANPVERVNRTIKSMIKATLEGEHKNWDRKLMEVTFAYNVAKHRSLGVSPALLNYGREPLPPNTVRQSMDRSVREVLDSEPLESWKGRMHRLPLLLEEAKEKMREAQREQAEHYNARRRERHFQIGDKVWRDNHVLSSAAQGISAKLSPRFVGPYTISRITGSNTYEITNSQGNVEGPIHVQQLKPYLSDESLQREEDNESEGSEEEEEVVNLPLPPLEKREEAKSDPPLASENAIGESTASVSKKRGRPRKNPTRIRNPARPKTPKVRPAENADPGSDDETPVATRLRTRKSRPQENSTANERSKPAKPSKPAIATKQKTKKRGRPPRAPGIIPRKRGRPKKSESIL